MNDAERSSNSEGESRKSSPLLLIDTKNSLYRVSYASKSTDEGILILLRLFNDWIRKFKPSGIIAAWDAPRSQVWRRDHHPGYKDRDQNRYVVDHTERIAEMTAIMSEMMPCLGIRQLGRDRMEADDLIYACASVVCPDDCIVISSDSDMAQIPYLLRNVKVFNAQKEAFSDGMNVLSKALAGDRSDSVNGYDGIGKVKAEKLISERAYRQQFFQERGWDILRESMLLVDLQCCPYLLDNKIYCMQKLAEPVVADSSKAASVIKNHKLKLVFMEQQRLLPVFGSLNG